jgi:hypothetical protein
MLITCLIEVFCARMQEMLRRKKTLSDLKDVFVDFKARKTEGMSVAFFNAGLRSEFSREDMLMSYAYLVDGSCNDQAREAELKAFQAERYGGGGIVRNGGGGRCGFDGRYHLKGIGPNRLVGQDSDAAHGNGCLCLATAIYESVWAEIIHLALPYGAIRTLAVLDTGLLFEQFGQQITRGLLVREPVVRPAHFIRAVYFKETTNGDLSEDAQRVRSAVRQLGGFLPRATLPTSGENPDALFADGMVELARRYACQFATARAKRITHLNVSASNLSIDGAWLDLSGTRIVTGVLADDRHEINGVLHEYRGALDSISDMCYYASKYAVINHAFAVALSMRAKSVFHAEYERQLFLSTALQVGFPLSVLRPVVEDTAYLDFCRCLQEVLGHDDYSVSSVTTVEGWEGSQHAAGALYLALLCSTSAEGHVPELAWLKRHEPLADRLLSAYGRLFAVVCESAAEVGICRSRLRGAMAVNLTRLNRYHNSLFDLQANITQHMELSRSDHEAPVFDGLVAAALSEAKLAFLNDDGARIRIWVSARCGIEYDLVQGCFVLDGVETHSAPLSALGLVCAPVGEAANVLAYYLNVKGFIDEAA